MKWLTLFIVSIFLAFIFYTLDVLTKMQTDVKKIKRILEKNF